MTHRIMNSRNGSIIYTLLLLLCITGTHGQCQDLLELTLNASFPSINITSPGYPSHHGNNLNCNWRLLYPEGQGITVRFYEVQTEQGYDFLTLSSDESDDTTGDFIYHGDIPPPITMYLQWRELWIGFTSDGAGNRRGFSMQVTTSISPECLDSEFSCEYKMTHLICLESYRRCDHINDCDDSSDELGCGLCFDNGTFVAPGETFTMISPGYPSPYDALLDCQFNVKAPNGYYIVINIIEFRIELEFDTLIFKPSKDTTEEMYLTLTGDTSPAEIYTNSNEVWIIFHTDTWTQYEGFKIEFSVENEPEEQCRAGLWACVQSYLTCFDRKYLCDLTNQCPNGIDEHNCPGAQTTLMLRPNHVTIITSPSYPVVYPSNIDIRWQILSPSKSFIRLVFTYFSLATNEDFVYIHPNDSNIETQALHAVTGTEAGGVVLVAETNELWLRFVAGDSNIVIPGMGFVIELTVEDMYQCAMAEFGCNKNDPLLVCMDANIECNFIDECSDASDEDPQCGFCWNPIFNIRDTSAKISASFSPLVFPPSQQCFAQISVSANDGIRIVLRHIALGDPTQLMISHQYIGAQSDVEPDDSLLMLSDKVVSVISFRSDVWIALVNVLNVVDFELEVSRFQTGDTSADACLDNSLPCASLLQSAVVCFNSTIRCDSIIDCPDMTDEQQCGTRYTTRETSTTSTMLTTMSYTLPMSSLPLTTSESKSSISTRVQSTTDFKTTERMRSITSPIIGSTPKASTDSTTFEPVDNLDKCSNSIVIVNIDSGTSSTILTLPGYPTTSYANNLKCQWLLIAEDSKGIAITINDLDLETNADFLIIYDGESEVIASLTGQPKITRIMLDNDETYVVQFTSDRTVRSIGFNIEISSFDIDSPRCTSTDFQCENIFCVDQSAPCNGINDCQDLSDEKTCNEIDCRGLLQCGEDQCIVDDDICDGIASCQNKEDEESCDEKRCPEDCECVITSDERLNIVCERGWIRAMSGVTDLPKIAKELDIIAEADFLQPGVFKTLSDLQKLTLVIGGTKNIREIPLGTFDKQEELIFLNITNLDDIAVLGKDTFQELKSLKVLIIWYSGNVEFDVDSLNGLYNLETLVIVKGDPLIDIDFPLTDDHIIHLHRLQTIYVDDKRLCCDIQDSVTCISLKASYSVNECGTLLGNDGFRFITYFLGFIGLIVNFTLIIALVIYNVYKYLKFRIVPVQYILIINLSCAYVLMGFYLLIIAIQDSMFGEQYQRLPRSWQSSSTCYSAAFLAFLSSEVSLGILLLLCMDRFTMFFDRLKLLRFTRRSATGCSLCVWCFCIILSTAFVYLIGPEENNNFGLSGVCFSIPYLVKPNKYSVTVDDTGTNQFNFDLSVYNLSNTAAWVFISTVFFVLNSLCVAIIVCLSITVSYLGVKKYRSNPMIHSNEIKFCIRLAPISLLTVVCWILIVCLKAADPGNMIMMKVHSATVLFILPLASALGPVLYVIMLYLTPLNSNESTSKGKTNSNKNGFTRSSHELLGFKYNMSNNSSHSESDVHEGDFVNYGYADANELRDTLNGLQKQTIEFQDGCEYATIGPKKKTNMATFKGDSNEQ